MRERCNAVLGRVGGTRRATVHVRLTAHAIERYIERVQPCADRALASRQLAALFALDVISPHPAPWDLTSRPAPMYLNLGDVSVVLDVDGGDRGRLVASTCLVRPCRSLGKRVRRARQRLMRRHGRRARTAYR